MKALADLKRRQISTSVVEALPDEDFNYKHGTIGKPARHGLHVVAPMEIPLPADSLDVGEVEFAKPARDADKMRSNVATDQVIRPTFNNKGRGMRMTNPKLTTEEFIEVRLATVRESTRHCYWPSDVVARFAAADVIR